MQVLLTGARGMLAAEVIALAPPDAALVLTDIEELDITDASAVEDFCRRTRPDAIINCAAYTAVDKAEEDQATAHAVNATGPAVLAHTAAARGTPLVHVSTDFVFFGDGGHALTEDDEPAPRGVYACSKRDGEIAIEQAGGQWLTVRTSWLYGTHGRSFPATILRLARERRELRVVDDQHGSPTYARNLAAALWRLVEVEARGYVHFSNSGACTWYNFAVATVREGQAQGLLDAADDIQVVPVTTAEFPRPAPRPAYSVMSTARYTQLTGVEPPAWQEGLHNFIAELAS
jgi:dTDP-4-dehydrorhamnose reductase